MSKRNLKGLWMPAEILLNKELSDKEKIILSMILYLSDETGSCFASNKYIASIVNVTSDRVSKIVSSLKKKGFIEVILKFKADSKEVESRQIIPNKDKFKETIDKFIKWICKKFDMGAENNLIRDFERENNTLLDAEKQVKREEIDLEMER